MGKAIDDFTGKDMKLLFGPDDPRAKIKPVKQVKPVKQSLGEFKTKTLLGELVRRQVKFWKRHDTTVYTFGFWVLLAVVVWGQL